MMFVFGECTLDVDRRELRRSGVVRALEPKAFTVLVYLLTQRHRAVAKDELLATCWPGEFVTEAALTRCLKVIRQAVADDGVRQHTIKTLRGHGYRFIATVETQPTPFARAAHSQLHEVPRHTHKAPPGRIHAIVPAAAAPAPELLDATSPAMRNRFPCPQCQTINRAARQFCAACGQALWQLCLHCGFGNDPTERFCGGCGRAVAAPVPVTTSARKGPPQAYTPASLATQILARQQEVIGERKYATVLVAGLDGVQALRQVETPEAVDDILNQGFAQVVAQVHQVEGFITQVTQHGGTAMFGVPLACEDHVLRALHAALGIRRAFAAFAAALHQNHGVWLTLRLGVHTGLVVVSAISADLRLVYTAPGATIECATGLQQLSRDGAIMVSATVQQQAAGFFQFAEMGTHTLPELAEPVQVYTCNGVGLVTSRLEGALARQHTAFQGRQQELALLQACWARVHRGTGQVVCLVGEAGMGKSRLAYECQRALGDARQFTAQALSYGQTIPYHAIIPLLRTMLGVVDTATPTQQRQAIRTRLAAIDPALEADTLLLAHGLGVPLETEPLPTLAPDAQRRRLQHACLEVLVQQTTNKPVCLLMEDCHWLDLSSQELLDLLIAALARRPLLVLCTARPGFRHTWADYTYFHQVAIEPLTAEESNVLLHDLLQPYAVSPALQAWLYERTGGNPFFVEELVRTLQARGLLMVQSEAYEIAPAALMTLPDSIQGIVQTRLDRLPVAEKHLLQVAAVIGSEVSWPLLYALMERAEDGLQHSLQYLQATEFLYETRSVPVPIYTFPHALVQEATYSSLLQERRRALHIRIIAAIEQLSADHLDGKVERLAHHALEGEVWDKALAYCRQAGEKAMARSAYREAVGHFEQALGTLAHLPKTRDTREQAIDLRLDLRSALAPLDDFGRILLALREAEALAAALDDPRRLCQISVALSLQFYRQGAHDQAIAAGQRALTLAPTSGDAVLHGLANQYLGFAYWARGDYRRAIDCFGQTVASLEATMRRERFGQTFLPAVLSRALLVACYAEWGMFPEGSALGDEGLRIAETLGHAANLMWGYYGVGLLSLRQGDLCRALPMLERAVSICQDADLPVYFPWTAAALGAAYTLGGRVADAVPLLTQALKQATATGRVTFQTLCSLSLGEAHVQAGRFEEAYALAEQALTLARTHQERGHQAYAIRLLGDIAAHRDPPERVWAESHYQHALALADELGMRPLVAHCRWGLGTMYATIGQRMQARTELSTAIGMYQTMEVTFWLRQAKETLAQVERG